MIYVYSAIASVTSVSVIIMSIVSFQKSNEKSLFGLNRDVHTTDYTRKGLLRKIEKRSGTGRLHSQVWRVLHYVRLLNSAQVMAVAMATLSDSVVGRSRG